MIFDNKTTFRLFEYLKSFYKILSDGGLEFTIEFENKHIYKPHAKLWQVTCLGWGKYWTSIIN